MCGGDLGEEWMLQCISPGRGARMSPMIWGCICWNGLGTLTIVSGNINAEVFHRMPLSFKITMHQYIVEDPCWITKLKLNNIQRMLWSAAQSPDANIENCWLLFKNQLRKCASRINNAADLEREIRRIWTTFPIHYIQNLYKSLLQRIVRIIRSKGYTTKY